VAEESGGGSGAKRGGVARVLAPLGLFAAGYLAGRFWLKPTRYAGSFVDRVVRRVVFQSIPETPATVERSAASLIGELTYKLYMRLVTHNLPSVAAAAAFFCGSGDLPGPRSARLAVRPHR
jgi:hypothetical protein